MKTGYSRSAGLQITNERLEQKVTSLRMIVAGLFIFICLGIVLFRIFYLQINSYMHYKNISNNNRILKKLISPNRGRIFDTNKKLLVYNKSVVNLYVKKEFIKNNFNELKKLKKIIKLSKKNIEFVKEGLKTKSKYILLKSNLTEREESRLLVNIFKYPWVSMQNSLQRSIIDKKSLSHSIGYIGRINKKEWRNIDRNIYQSSYLIGKTGIEKTYESALHGTSGIMEIEVDAVGKQVSNISDTPAKNGKDIKLYMDYNLQKKSYELMKGKKGCIIAIEPETGGIISMTSVPSFNINKFTSRSLSKKDYKELTDDKDLPLFNRCLAGTYPPASLIKPFTALGALEYEVIKPSYTIWDKGWYKLAGNNRKYRNWKRSGHGSVDLHKAIMVSNDTYFYNLAYRMSIDKISTNLADFGFGTKVGLDVGKNEKIGILPTRAWKKKYKKLDWFPGDTINVGIGQGYLLTTPMQLVYATSIIANRGKRNLLRFIKEIDGQKELFAKNPDDLKFKKENIDFIINAMHDVMQNKKGTGYWRAGRFSRYQVAGKTGTAQVIAMQQEEKRYDKTKVKKRFHDNAMFLGFSPLKKPKIAIIVIIENGGGGGSIAAPIGVKLMNYYLDMQKKNRKFVSK